MKKIAFTLLASAFLLYACNNEKKEEKTASMETKKDGKMAKDPCEGVAVDSASMPKMDSAMMQAWMESATPGEMHKMLAMSDGEWTGDVTHWMDPAAPATKSTANSSNKMILGGRFQQSETSGCMGGMGFEGFGLVGYDNTKKVFMSTWMDNMGTTMMNLAGPYDAATKTMHLTGTCTNPMGGGDMTVREDFTIIDNDNQKMIMWMPDMAGKEFKTMEILFTRKK